MSHRPGDSPRSGAGARAQGTGAPALPPTLRLGRVELTVADLERSVRFYERAAGLQLRRREGAVAAMGAGRGELVVLVERPGARPAGRHAGLYHFALLHPSRLELARGARRLAAARIPIDGASDHGISEAIYLSDPDGNGVELAADRPRELWGDLSDPAVSAPRPLDLRGLLELPSGEDAPPRADPGLAVGHVHLHVGDVARGVAFYCGVLGFQAMTRFPTAAFVSAGGYHHHLAFNTWRGEGVPPAPADAAGLRLWTVVLGSQADVAALRERVAAAGVEGEERDGGILVRDPWRNAALFVASPAAVTA